ncbi:hypothetical protein [Streptomyces sp. NPDC048419]|uniref:hypothetical protein n=1 Tax=Streptomyces sp. NPDC048419 TaxID=3365547 RepID=UPI003711ECA1
MALLAGAAAYSVSAAARRARAPPKGNSAPGKGGSTSGPPTGTKGNAPSQSGRTAGGMGGRGTNSEIATWVKQHGTAVGTYGGLCRLDASDVG